MDGPHIRGFSPAALCINFTSLLASVHLVESERAAINAATLCLEGVVLFSAISSPFCFIQRLTQGFENEQTLPGSPGPNDNLRYSLRPTTGCTIVLSGPQLHGNLLPAFEARKMNVHVSYKVQKTPDIEKEVSHQIEKIQKRLQVFRPDLVNLKAVLEQ